MPDRDVGTPGQRAVLHVLPAMGRVRVELGDARLDCSVTTAIQALRQRRLELGDIELVDLAGLPEGQRSRQAQAVVEALLASPLPDSVLKGVKQARRREV